MKTILITGANSGIGFAIVNIFLQKGYKVFAHYHKDNDNLNKIKSNNLLLFQADFSKENEINKLFKNVITIAKKVDVLVNNAAYYKRESSFNDINLDEFEKSMKINVKAPFILSHRYIQCMKKYNMGRIINISSIGVKYGGSSLSIFYTMSKSALESMSITLAKESAKYNILVNTIRVGVTDTQIHQNKNLKERINMIPLKRMATPNEIAQYVYCISLNNFITGSIETIAGGE